MNNMNDEYNKLWRFLSDHIPDRNLVTKIADYMEKEYGENIVDYYGDEIYNEGYSAAEDELRDEADTEYHNGFSEAKEKIIKYLYETLDSYEIIVGKIRNIQPD